MPVSRIVITFSSDQLILIQTVSMDVFVNRVHDADILVGGDLMRYAKWVAVVLLVAPTIAMAQVSAANQVVAQVPFTFIVADKVMPLGEVIVQRAGTVDQALMVTSPGSKQTVFALASANDDKKAAAAYSLIFHKYGRRYFLAGMRIEGSQAVYSFKPSKFEAELIAQNVPVKDEVLLASLR